jgi:hypothetical protein
VEHLVILALDEAIQVKHGAIASFEAPRDLAKIAPVTSR